MVRTKEATMISLFAGAGGLDIGLEQAGFLSLAVNELQPHACESLRQNKLLNSMEASDFNGWFQKHVASQRCYSYGASSSFIDDSRRRLYSSVGKHSHLDRATIVEGDIRTVSSSDMMEAAGVSKGGITLVAGGPPCQPFSRAGKRQTVETGDGKLFLEFKRMVDEIRPRWFLFENVKGLAQSKTTVPYAVCTSCKDEIIVPFTLRDDALQAKPLDLVCRKCGSKNHDIATKELRGGSLDIIVEELSSIGYTCYHTILNAADYGVPQSRERLFIVGSRDNEPFSWPVPTHCEYLEKNEQLSLLNCGQSEKHKWRTVKEVLWQDGHPQFGTLDYAKALIWVKNVVRPHDEPVTWTLDRPSPTVGAHQGAKLAIAPYGVPEEQLARQQWHVLGKRQGDTPPVKVQHAMLSDEELLLLQTFPRGWYLHGTRMERAFQIGNAVPPTFAKAVGQAILQASNL